MVKAKVMAKKSPKTIYSGYRDKAEPNAAGDSFVTVTEANSWGDLKGHQLDPTPSQALRNHSPTGFSWGYGGSGPAQLALAILLDYYGDERFAQRYYQSFKWQTVARWPASRDWTITGEEIEKVIDSLMEKEGKA